MLSDVERCGGVWWGVVWSGLVWSGLVWHEVTLTSLDTKGEHHATSSNQYHRSWSNATY
jgi:hypothetical protein